MRIKNLALILIFTALPLLSNSQEKVKVKKQDFKTEKEGFNNAWKALQDGEDLYRDGEAYYGEALQRLLFAYKYNETVAELNYLVGVCYLMTDQKQNALQYIQKAYDLKPGMTKDILILLARSLHQNYEFEKAAEYYRAFADTIGKEKRINPVNITFLIISVPL